VAVKTMAGVVIPEGTPIATLVVPGREAELEVHPDSMPKQRGRGSKRPTGEHASA
jgi:hypothetical protein